MEGKGTQGTTALTAEGEPLGEGCPHSCPLQLQPLTFLALDHSLPTRSPGKEAMHFVVSTGTVLGAGTAGTKWLFQAKQVCHSSSASQPLGLGKAQFQLFSGISMA